MSLQTLHSIVDLPIAEGAPGSSLPFLFLDGGEPSFLTLAWVRQKVLNEGVGSSTVAKAVAAIGRFYNFYMREKRGEALAPNELPLTLSQFYEARRFGLASTGWTPVKQATAADDVRAVSEFTEWCANNFGHAAANPAERVMVSSLRLSEQRAFHAKLAGSKRWNPLYHLFPSTEQGQGTATRRAFVPGKGKKSKQAHAQKYFPPNQVWPFIASTPSLRDKLYFLLLFFGGLRISEPLHLFATDVSIRPVGTYNPDWALLVSEENASRLVLVKETKSSTRSKDLRGAEKLKIEYGRRHFEAIGVRFEAEAVRARK